MLNSKMNHRQLKPSSNVWIFYVGAFWGLVAGFGQLVILGFEKFIRHDYVHTGAQVLWMTPLADILFFLLGAFLLWLLAHLAPRLVSSKFIVFAFAFLGYLSLLIMATWLNVFAAIVLAMGLALETTHLIASHDQGFERLVRLGVGWTSLVRLSFKSRRTEKIPSAVRIDTGLTRRQFVLSLGAILAGLKLGTTAPDLLHDWIEVVDLPAAPRKAPNVLFIVLDTVRAQSLSLFGYNRPTTPNLARLAQKGVLFERAISTVSWTLPSHATMFTGHFPHELSADRKTPLDATYSTLAERLGDEGYMTSGFVANLEYCTAESGLGQGFVDYDDYDISLANLVNDWSLGDYLSQRPRFRQWVDNWNTLGRKSATHINAEFLRWLDHKGNHPFFTFLNYFDAHSPYYPPEPFASTFGPITPRDSPLAEKWVHKKDIPPNVLQAEMNAYDGAIAYIDHEVGVLYDELDRRGILNDTVIIITADHGEEFGEHDVFSHGQSLYLPSIHVPLLIIYPALVPAGKRIAETASLRDIGATIMELSSKNPVTVPGKSLVRYWSSPAGSQNASGEIAFSELKYAGGFPSWFPISRGNMQSLVTNRYHYVRNGDGQEELYDWANDPWEQSDLAKTADGRDQLTQFRTWLKAYSS